MRVLVGLLFLFTVSVGAEEINKDYSYKDFTNGSLRDVKVEELNNTVIVGSCFYREGEPNCLVFPDGMIGVIFRECDLNNVFVPPGNVIIGGCHNNLVRQNDGQDWKVDASLKPIEPMNKRQRIEAGISCDPKDIPAELMTDEEQHSLMESINDTLSP